MLLNVILILQSLGVSIPGLAAARKVVIAPPLTSIKGLTIYMVTCVPTSTTRPVGIWK